MGIIGRMSFPRYPNSIRMNRMSHVCTRFSFRFRIVQTSCAENNLRTAIDNVKEAIRDGALEVKVAIASPPATIRPDMLVTATFLAPEQQPGSESDDSQQQERLLVPRQLVESAGDGDRVTIGGEDGSIGMAASTRRT